MKRLFKRIRYRIKYTYWSITEINQLKRDIKGVFKPMKRVVYFGKAIYGCPYFFPWAYENFILAFRKTKRYTQRTQYFELFGYFIYYGWPIAFVVNSLGWKDKFGTPRFEWCPAFHLYFFGLQLRIHWCAPDDDNDKYFEMVQWYRNYCDKDINKAKDDWGWVDMDTKESTWKNEYIIQK